MKKLFIALFSLMILLSISTTANAAVLTFDDYTTITSPEFYVGMPQYGGFNWGPAGLIGVIDTTSSHWSYYNPVSESGKYVAISGYSFPINITTVASGTTFTFNSVYLSTLYLYQNASDTITINGYDSANTLVYQDYATVYQGKITYFDGKDHYQNISRLELISSVVPNDNGNLMLDNFTFNASTAPTPEPSSMIFGLVSLVGILRLKKRLV